DKQVNLTLKLTELNIGQFIHSQIPAQAAPIYYKGKSGCQEMTNGWISRWKKWKEEVQLYCLIRFIPI
ncbi:MAG: hypothetical protein P8017_04740, partial [Deltaproteobacteria bacterium]